MYGTQATTALTLLKATTHVLLFVSGKKTANSSESSDFENLIDSTRISKHQPVPIAPRPAVAHAIRHDNSSDTEDMLTALRRQLQPHLVMALQGHHAGGNYATLHHVSLDPFYFVHIMWF